MWLPKFANHNSKHAWMTLKDSPSSPANHHKSAKHAPRANPHFVPAQQSMRPQPFVHSKQQREQTEKACGRVGGSQNMPKNRCRFFSTSSVSLWSTGGLGLHTAMLLLDSTRVHYQQTPAFKRARAILNDCCKDSPACNNSSCDRQFRTQSQKTVFSHASSIISNLCNFQIDHEPQWSWLENYKNRIKGKRASSHLLQCTLLKYQKLQWFHLHWQTAHEHLLYRKEKSVSISIFHCTWTILKTHNIPNDFCLPINQSEHSLVNLHFLFFRCFLSTAISCENHHLWCMAWSCGAWRSEQKKVPAWFMPFCKFTPCQTHYPILWFTV